MFRFASVLTVSTCIACSPAFAQDDNLSYTYFEVDYLNLDVDVIDDNSDILDDIDDGDGWAVNGSLAFTPRFFGFSSYSVTDSDVTFVDPTNLLITSNQDVKRFSTGLGFNVPVFEEYFSRADFVARAGYTDIDFDDFDLGGTDSDPLDDFEDAVDDLNEDSSDGYFVDALIRAQIGRPLEASAGVRYTEIEESDDVSFVGNVLWEFSPSWGLDLSADVGDEVAMWMVGLRYTFHGG